MALDRISVFDIWVLLLLAHVVGGLVVMIYYGEGRSKSTSLWRYLNPTVFAVVLTVASFLGWLLSALGDPTHFERLEPPIFAFFIGVCVLSFAFSNALLLARILAAKRREGPPAPGDAVVASGRARPLDGTFETPFGETEALCAHATVEAFETGMNSNVWAEHDERIESRPFEIERQDAPVHVRPEKAHWSLPRTHGTTVDADDQLPRQVAAAFGTFSDLDRPTNPRVGTSITRHRYRERTLRPGDPVLVLGEVTECDDGVAVVADGTPFVVKQGEADLVYQIALAWTVGGTVVGLWLLSLAFGPLIAGLP